MSVIYVIRHLTITKGLHYKELNNGNMPKSIVCFRGVAKTSYQFHLGFGLISAHLIYTAWHFAKSQMIP